MLLTRAIFTAAALALAAPAFPQSSPTVATGPVIDILGMWSGQTGTMEEQPLRGDPGVEVGEYVGMPINAAARQHADSWPSGRTGRTRSPTRCARPPATFG
jgi:hypothetical protein